MAANIRTPRRTTLDEFFSTESTFTDRDCTEISRLLLEEFGPRFSAAPRIYIVLRIIDQVAALQKFLSLGCNDLWFPFDRNSLPKSLPQSYQDLFLEAQSRVITKGLDLEDDEKRHVRFVKGETIPLREKGLIARGGYGIVDKVQSQISGREFARKTFRRGNTRISDLKSFATELQVLKRINHHHCVELVASYTDPKYFGLLMLPLADCNLEQYFAQVPSSQGYHIILRTFFGCLASALSYLHNEQIRHRDIKPSNILVKGPKVYLTDFGISLDWQDRSRSTTTGNFGKSIPYCAPEVQNEEKRNSKSDVFSLGCVFIEILTVLCGETIQEMRNRFRNKSGTFFFSNNIASSKEWAHNLQMPLDGTDRDVLDWIDQTVAFHEDARLTSNELYKLICSSGMDHRYFCEHCMLDNDSSSGVDDDPNSWSDEEKVHPRTESSNAAEKENADSVSDFNFEESLAKFDKSSVFREMRNEGPVAHEERLVSTNRAQPRLAEHDVEDLHPSKRVLVGAKRYYKGPPPLLGQLKPSGPSREVTVPPQTVSALETVAALQQNATSDSERVRARQKRLEEEAREEAEKRARIERKLKEMTEPSVKTEKPLNPVHPPTASATDPVVEQSLQQYEYKESSRQAMQKHLAESALEAARNAVKEYEEKERMATERDEPTLKTEKPPVSNLPSAIPAPDAIAAQGPPILEAMKRRMNAAQKRKQKEAARSKPEAPKAKDQEVEAYKLAQAKAKIVEARAIADEELRRLEREAEEQEEQNERAKANSKSAEEDPTLVTSLKKATSGLDAASAPSESSTPTPTWTTTANGTTVPRVSGSDPVKPLKTFSASEKARIAERQRMRAKHDKAVKLHDLKKFSQNFKLHTPIPEDLVPFIADGDRKQQDMNKRLAEMAEQAEQSKQEVPKRPTQTELENAFHLRRAKEALGEIPPQTDEQVAMTMKIAKMQGLFDYPSMSANNSELHLASQAPVEIPLIADEEIAAMEKSLEELEMQKEDFNRQKEDLEHRMQMPPRTRDGRRVYPEFRPTPMSEERRIQFQEFMADRAARSTVETTAKPSGKLSVGLQEYLAHRGTLAMPGPPAANKPRSGGNAPSKRYNNAAFEGDRRFLYTEPTWLNIEEPSSQSQPPGSGPPNFRRVPRANQKKKKAQQTPGTTTQATS